MNYRKVGNWAAGVTIVLALASLLMNQLSEHPREGGLALAMLLVGLALVAGNEITAYLGRRRERQN